MNPNAAENERLRKLAVEIGNSGIVHRYREIIPLLHHSSPQVRRATASALGKLVDIDPSIKRHISISISTTFREEKGDQVLQYMLRTLAKCGSSIDDDTILAIQDLSRDATQKPYVREAANEVLAAFEKGRRLSESLHRHWCSRCRRPLTKEESAETIQKWGKPYCRHCADEREFENVRFEATVEGAKQLRTLDKIAVQSRGEKLIGDYLTKRNIRYIYDERYRIAKDTLIRPDFYLPEFDLYIEFWGMDTHDYLARKREKLELYQRAGKKLVSIEPKDLPKLTELLDDKLLKATIVD